MTRPSTAFAVSLALFAPSTITSAKTLCVSQHPSPACPYSTISAAVAAASNGDIVRVSPGTYREDVVIGKAISLIGANERNTIVDATGLSNGVYVDGMDTPGLGAVVVSDFTVRNAKFEGILLTNVTDVTVSDNRVTSNNINLIASGCPDIPDFETNEGFDCGEGVHLSGVDHSIIAGNLIEGNSGGILLSDDTGATHDNLILKNIVRDNPFDCGITLASHTLFSATPGPPTAAGVYHNTITGNVSQHNGYETPGAGAGVGIFAGAPFNKTYGNVIVNNELLENGLPGVAMHAHAPGATLSDNVIADNRINGNGADTADTPTPGPAGINVSGGVTSTAVSGTLIAGNEIGRETDGVVTGTSSFVSIHLNNFFGVPTGVDNLATGTDGAQLNWWGCFGGPTAPGCANVQGANIIFTPFLSIPDSPGGND
ncbi:MAG: right-handed parallel beta-helix repeat-containing protein [Candidatus Acidiferrales bacterium]